MHLPLLSRLSLNDGHRFGLREESPFAEWALLAHPTVRHLELCFRGLKSSDACVRALLQSDRLPKLEHVSCTHFD
jgi:hypothetical protein